MKLFKFLNPPKPLLEKKTSPKMNFFGLSFLIAGLGAGFIFFKWNRLPPELPLYYSRPWGQAQIGSLNSFLLLPLLGALISFVNFFLTKTFFRQNSFLTRALEINSLILNSLLLVTIIKIIGIIL